ncbi:type 1 glutamine amidotransferase domain-containing protein [Anaerococcus sp. Marseille-Q5996]|uniref:type 1 glutamine amidotransferase domain-containing protein n=1 Tax=Anaerococcus sp. Marseille-Q5996 TaxID=2972769 RepID=UPI0021C9B60A|nr:type 1 glutamine amidotransferase domain-containing protein [Anaerococcus sp. Marseille-Q5996]
MDKKILVVMTNTGHYGNDSEKTGLWLAEATEFVDKVKRNGIAVDYVSPKGGQVPLDPRSMQKPYASKKDYAILNSLDFKTRAINNSLKPSDINPKDYFAIYFTGGHGVLWDFPKNTELIEIAENIYNNDGYLLSVCHGVVGLLNIRDKNGNYLINDRYITGFTDQEEILGGKKDKVPYSAEQEAKLRGAHFLKTLPYTPNAVKCGRLITGQNPMSGKAVARKLIKDLKKRELYL